MPTAHLFIRYWLLTAVPVALLGALLSLLAQVSQQSEGRANAPARLGAETSLREALQLALSAPGAWSGATVTVAAAHVDGLAAEVSLVNGSVAAPPFAVSSPEVSRLVTALLVLESERLGELALDEPIARVLPELHALPGALTVRDLLRGDTGLRDIRDVLEVRGLGETRTASMRDALGWVARQRVSSRVPSTWDNDVATRESPTEDLLLALALEARAGAPFPALAAERLFAPLEMGDTYVSLDSGGDVDLGALYGFRGVVTTARDLARLGVGLASSERIAPEVAETALGISETAGFASRTRPYGVRWCAKDARVELGRTWRVFATSRLPTWAGLEPRWFREPETARLAVLPSEGWAVAAVVAPGGAPAGTLPAVVAAATEALDPWLPPRFGHTDSIGIGGGAGGRYGGRLSGPLRLDDTQLIGEHQVPELGLTLTVERIVSATPPRYEIRLGARRPVTGALIWQNGAVVLVSGSDAHMLRLQVALDGDLARFESLDLEHGFTTYGPLLALVVEAADGK